MESPFAGFLDGLQARNLAQIERNTELQLSEMQARLNMIKAELTESGGEILPDIEAIERSLNSPTGSIVDRLFGFGQLLAQLFIKRSKSFKDRLILNQFTGLVNAYTDAVERSRSERLLDAGILVARSFAGVLPPIAEVK